eukprot:15447747-Alexandrium_andersonii.AAC.1
MWLGGGFVCYAQASGSASPRTSSSPSTRRSRTWRSSGSTRLLVERGGAACRIEPLVGPLGVAAAVFWVLGLSLIHI